MNFNNIPAELRVLPQWAVFRTYTDKEGKHKKIIISPVNSKFAKCNEPETWSDFETAKRYCLRNRYKGLVFTLTSGITFIDIDHAVDKNTGAILSEEAKQLMLLLADTYIERSVSGTGIHILMRGSLPDNAHNRNDKKGLEMYDTNRFICVTGDLLSSGTTLKDCSELVTKINRDFIGVRPEPVTFSRTESDWSPSDAELVDKIRSSKIADRFDALMSGGNCENHSSADFALCSLLAWWTRDAAQIDRALQAQSSRYEPKTRQKAVYRTPAEM